MPKPKRFRTPEEEKRVQEAQADIKEREKFAARQGISSKEAAERLSPRVQAREEARAKQVQIAANQPLRESLVEQTGKVPPVEIPKETLPSMIPLPTGTPEQQAIIDKARAEGKVWNPVSGTEPSTPLTVPGTDVTFGDVLKTGIGKMTQRFSFFGFNPIRDFTAKIKSEQQAKINVKYGTLKKSAMGMKTDINIVKKGGDGSIEAWKDFQDQISALYKAEAEITMESKKDLNKFLDVDTTIELGNIEAFKEQLLPGLILRMQDALNNPDPNTPDIEVDLSDYGITPETQSGEGL